MTRLRALATASAAALLAWACLDGGPTENGRLAPLDLVPRFQLDPSLFDYDPIDRIRLVAFDAETADVLGSANQAVDPAATQWLLDLAIDLGDAPSLVVVVEVELLSSGVVQWSGRMGPVTVPARSTVQAVDLYRGPLDNLDVLALDVTGAPSQMGVGGSATLGAGLTLVAGSTANPIVYWASSDPTVLTVTGAGPTATLTAVGLGTATIQAAAGEAFFEFPVEVVAGIARTWVGGATPDPTAWNEAANWSPPGAPTSADDVLVPALNFGPVMSSDVTIGSLTAQGTLDQGGFTLTVTGDVAVSGGLVNGTTELASGAGTSTVHGTFDAVVVSGPTVLDGALTANGDLDVLAPLDIGPNVDIAYGSFGLRGAGASLVMRDQASQLGVQGDALFDGASSAGDLTAGAIQVIGNFTALSTHSATSFQPSGTLVYLTPVELTQTVTLDNPGPTGQSFADLYLSSEGPTIVFASDVLVRGSLFAGSATLRQGGSSTLEVRGTLTLDVVTFDGLPLRLVSDVAPDQHVGTSVRFTNFPATATQLYLSLPGAGPDVWFQLISPVFDQTEPNPGYYIDAVNSAPQNGILVISVLSPSPVTTLRYRFDKDTELYWNP